MSPSTPRKGVSPRKDANQLEASRTLTRDDLRDELDTFARGTLAALFEQRLTDVSESMIDSINEKMHSSMHSLKQDRLFSGPPPVAPKTSRCNGNLNPKHAADGNGSSAASRARNYRMTYKAFDYTKANSFHYHWSDLDPEFEDAFPDEEPIGELHDPFVRYAWTNARARTFDELTAISTNASEDSEKDELRARETFLTNIHDRPLSWESLASFVKTSHFENVSGVIILLNAFFLGVMTDYKVKETYQKGTHGINGPKGSVPVVFVSIDLLFVFIFVLELALRLVAYNSGFVRHYDFSWNCFDACVIGAQVLETICMRLLAGHFVAEFSFVKMLRVLRLVRILRLVRVFRQLMPLANLVAAILNSIKSLCWTLLLMFIVIYNFSVFFTQVVWIAMEDGNKDVEGLMNWFGGMGRTALTLYEAITGGVSWCEIVDLLMTNIGVAVGILFCIYIALCVFILLNIVTGVFVDQATGMEKEGSEEAAAKDIRDLFLGQDLMGGTTITASHFRRMLHNKEMQKYFKVINVCPSEGISLFRLLDVDDSGTLDAHELVDGLLRLRGHAKALEHALLMRQVRSMDQDVCHKVDEIQEAVFELHQEVRECSGRAGIAVPSTRLKSRNSSGKTLEPGDTPRSTRSCRSDSIHGDDALTADKARNDIISRRNSNASTNSHTKLSTETPSTRHVR